MGKIVISNSCYDNIPYNVYYKENINYKGLVFVQHGFGSNKERGTDSISLNLARNNYFVVSVDAYKHGERIEEPFISGPAYKMFADAIDVVHLTAKDILRLYDNVFAKSFNSFDVIGISLGGMIAYLLSTFTNKINKLVPVISSPMFTKIVYLETEIDELEKYLEIVNKKRAEVELFDPSKNIDKMKYKKMFILNGTKDTVIPKRHSEAFYEQFSVDNVTFKLYEEGHNVSRGMQEDILSFITDKSVRL